MLVANKMMAAYLSFVLWAGIEGPSTLPACNRDYAIYFPIAYDT